MFDYTGSKNETAAKKQARADLTALFYDFLVEKFGSENVGMVENNTIGFAFGTIVDKEGFTVDMIATVKPVIKNYQPHVGEKRVTDAFDFDQARQDFAEEQETKKVKKNEK